MCPNDTYNELLNLYLNDFNESFPIIEISSKTKQPKHEPWYTPGLRLSSKTKAKLLLKKLSIPSKHNIHKYKVFNILHKKLQRRLKATNF